MNKLYKAIRYGSFIGMGIVAAGFAEPDPSGLPAEAVWPARVIILAVCAAAFLTTEYLKKRYKRSYIVKRT